MTRSDALTAGSGGRLSICAGTLIHTRQGRVPVEFVQAGDFVLGQSEAGGELTYRRVAHANARHRKDIFFVHYLLADEELPRTLVVTGNLPFWVCDVGWRPAQDLSVGSGLQLLEDVEAHVTGVAPVLGAGSTGLETGSPEAEANGDVSTRDDGEIRTMRVFNLEVEDCQSCFVGEAGVWVHDEKPASRPSANGR